MVAERPITDYTSRDYTSLLASMLDLAALKLPEWTDRSENDLGRLLLESFAYVGDVLLYYQDRIANEAFLSTAVERRSVIDLLALIGYTLATPAPATAELTLEAPNNTTDPIRIEPGAKFATKASPGNPAIEFIYLPADNPLPPIPRTGTGGTITYPDPRAASPQRKLIVTHATQIRDEVVGQSLGDANQSFRLTQRPVLLSRNPEAEGYLKLEVGVGGTWQVWSRKGTLLNSFSNDTHYLAQVNDADEVEVLFGDGQYGQIPRAGSIIRATYLIGGGAAGNVGRSTITQIKSGVVPSSIKVTNPQAASGGEERETIENARRQAPGVFRSRQRAVTEADYVALAENFPGVVRATAVAPSWNYVDIYVVTAGNFRLTDDLRARLMQYFDDKRMLTALVAIRQPVFVAIHITVAELGVEPTFYLEDVRRRVEGAIAALFDIERLEFGQSFYLSKVYEAIENVPGVAYARNVTFRGVRSKPPGEVVEAAQGLIQLRPREFAQHRQDSPTLTLVRGGVEQLR